MRRSRRWIATWARGGRMLIMLGPVFNHDASGFAQVGLEALARRWGIGIGDNLVVDPAHASDIEGPSVWAGGRRRSCLPHRSRPASRGAPTIWPRARQVQVPRGVAPAGAAAARARPGAE